MPPRVTPEQRSRILDLLSRGFERETIALEVGVTKGQVSAIAAHRTMGTYHAAPPNAASPVQAEAQAVGSSTGASAPSQTMRSIPIGPAVDSDEMVFWNPDPASGSANPHVLVLGQSGFGKTYALSCLIAELAQREIPSIVLDYGQGFTLASAPAEFTQHARPRELHASREGLDLNPLRLFASDLHGPVNVAQRIADTFKRVYPQLGVQQHAILRDAVLETLDNGGISRDSDTWDMPPPPLGCLKETLDRLATDSDNPSRRQAATLAAHISTLFVFDVLRPSGVSIDLDEVVRGEAGAHILQLKGLEVSIERAITELVLWHIIGYVESLGPGPLRLFLVLDEAHKLAFSPGSPVEKILREGRKFGLGVILASQQPDDFSPVAYSNTATKLVFQITDDGGKVSRHLARSMAASPYPSQLAETISLLPRGVTLIATESSGTVTHVASLSERVKQWQ